MWQVEEAVASMSGMHVVSDGLIWWDGRLPASGGAAASLTALRLLESVTGGSGVGNRAGLLTPEWQWGDAGDFLRFRTANQDVWFSAMLPERFLEWIDEIASPSLPNEGMLSGDGFDVSFTVDAEEWVKQMSGLSDTQLRYGYLECYGDPTDARALARRAVLNEILAPISWYPGVTRLLGSLSHAQWERLCTDGLRSPVDLGPELHELLMAVLLGDLQRTDPAARDTAGLTGMVQLLMPGVLTPHLSTPGSEDMYRVRVEMQNGREVSGTVLRYLPAHAVVHVPPEGASYTQHEGSSSPPAAGR